MRVKSSKKGGERMWQLGRTVTKQNANIYGTFYSNHQ